MIKKSLINRFYNQNTFLIHKEIKIIISAVKYLFMINLTLNFEFRIVEFLNCYIIISRYFAALIIIHKIHRIGTKRFFIALIIFQ